MVVGMVGKFEIERPQKPQPKDVASPEAVRRIWQTASKAVRAEAQDVQARHIRSIKRGR